MAKKWIGKNILSKATPAVTPAASAHTPQEFLDAYNRLCAEYGYKLSATPGYAAIGDSTWGLVIRLGVAEFKPPTEQE